MVNEDQRRGKGIRGLQGQREDMRNVLSATPLPHLRNEQHEDHHAHAGDNVSMILDHKLIAKHRRAVALVATAPETLHGRSLAINLRNCTH